ncbi:hypothetical protein QVA66_02130 [Staphylococcus chromogenes]|nr:hypothetical protein [Staphylococcus chromogenes]
MTDVALLNFEKKIQRTSLPAENREQLVTAWRSSSVAFAAACTSLMQGKAATEHIVLQLKALLDDALLPGSPTHLRDLHRIGQLAALLRDCGEKVAVVCENINTRMWLAARLREALDFPPHPDNSGLRELAADPTAEAAGRIAIISSGNPLLERYDRQVSYPLA